MKESKMQQYYDLTFLTSLIRSMTKLPEIRVELFHDVAPHVPHHGVLDVLELVPRVLEVGLFEEEIPARTNTRQIISN